MALTGRGSELECNTVEARLERLESAVKEPLHIVETWTTSKECEPVANCGHQNMSTNTGCVWCDLEILRQENALLKADRQWQVKQNVKMFSVLLDIASCSEVEVVHRMAIAGMEEVI